MIRRILSFLFMLYLALSSFFGVELRGYTSRQLFSDTDFSDGFTVVSQKTDGARQIKLGDFTYFENGNSPSWTVAQWNSGPCLWENRVESDAFTLTDGQTKTVRYNPDEKSVSLRLNAANVYGGEAAGDGAWPHLLLEQSPLCDYHSLDEKDRAFYNCSADRTVMSLDIRISDFKDTLNSEGINAVQFLSYIYLSGVNSDDFIWFGLNLFDSRGYMDTLWQKDTVGGLMIYSLSTKDTFRTERRSLFRNGRPYVSDEWLHVEIDLTDHIDMALKKANADNLFGREVSRKDFFIGGTNIGFEVHGNYDCTVEIRDYKLTTYKKA